MAVAPMPVLLCLTVGLLLVPQVAAWGKLGHTVVGAIAQGLLSDPAASFVAQYLPTDAPGLGDSDNAYWADEVKGSHGCKKDFPCYKWSAALHFADVANDKCGFVKQRDCPRDACVVGALANYTSILSTAVSSATSAHITLRKALVGKPAKLDHQAVEEALLFLDHFYGDIHQPLHCGHVEDKGGNDINVQFIRRQSNLHSVWDDLLIDHAMVVKYGAHATRPEEGYDSWLEDLQSALQTKYAKDIDSWTACGDTEEACASLFASESAQYACKMAYVNVDNEPITDGALLTEDYYNSRIPVVELRLLQAGVRLADDLNSLFASSGSS